MVQSTTTKGTKVCSQCGQEKPITEFRRRKRGSEQRHHECRACYNKYMRARRASHRNKRIAGFARDLSSPRSPVSRMPAMCTAMVQQFGGLERLCAEWKRHIEIAAARRPGSRMVLQSLRAIVKLIEIADAEAKKRKANMPDVRDLSDEELQRELGELLK